MLKRTRQCSSIEHVVQGSRKGSLDRYARDSQACVLGLLSCFGYFSVNQQFFQIVSIDKKEVLSNVQMWSRA